MRRTLTHEQQFVVPKDLLADTQAWELLKSVMVEEADAGALERKAIPLQGRWGSRFFEFTKVEDAPDGMEIWKLVAQYELPPEEQKL